MSRWFIDFRLSRLEHFNKCQLIFCQDDLGLFDRRFGPSWCSVCTVCVTSHVHGMSTVTVHPVSPSHSLTHIPPSLYHSHSRWRNLYCRHFVMTVMEVASQSICRNWLVLLLEEEGLERQIDEFILVEFGHVGITVNPILFKYMWHLMYPLLLEYRPPTCVCLFHHGSYFQHHLQEFSKKKIIKKNQLPYISYKKKNNNIYPKVKITLTHNVYPKF